LEPYQARYKKQLLLLQNTNRGEARGDRLKRVQKKSKDTVGSKRREKGVWVRAHQKGPLFRESGNRGRSSRERRERVHQKGGVHDQSPWERGENGYHREGGGYRPETWIYRDRKGGEKIVGAQ